MIGTRILVVSSHADDMELCAGASVSRWIREGKQVMHLCFSRHKSIAPDLEEVGREWAEAQDVLGVTDRVLLDFGACDGNFQGRRGEVYSILEGLRSRFDTVVCPSPHDTNQDHQTVAEECLRVFKKHCSILWYVFYNNNLTDIPNLFVRVAEEDTSRKVRAVQRYRSQLRQETHNYTRPQYLWTAMAFEGGKIMAPYAEGFVAVRLVV